MSAHFARTHVQVGRIFQESHHIAKVRSGWARLARRNERRKLNQCIFEGLLDLEDEARVRAEEDAAQALAEEEREIDEQISWCNDDWLLDMEDDGIEQEREAQYWKEFDAEMDYYEDPFGPYDFDL